VKRLAVTLPQLADRNNLLLATWKAARGKHQRPEVAGFLADIDSRVNRLARAILSGQAPQGRQRQFVIHDPKRRVITAACFDDRVLHHAILNLTEPRFEQMLVHGTYACRPGKGVHAAVAAVQQNLHRAQNWPWFVKVDIDGYFPAIDHGILKWLLARRFKGAEFLALLGRIVDAGVPVVPGGAAGKGLPIGALTSQHFANAYLDGADRFLLDHPGVGSVVRYMDDMVWWCPSLEAAHTSLAGLTEWLLRERALRLKAGVQIGRSAQGMQYCGFRIRQGVLLSSARKLARYRRGLARVAQGLAHGHASPAQAQRAHDSTLAILAGTQSLDFRRRCLAQDAAASHPGTTPPRYDPTQGCAS
jgi:RNA-directed DNA polymerase